MIDKSCNKQHRKIHAVIHDACKIYLASLKVIVQCRYPNEEGHNVVLPRSATCLVRAF